MSLSIFLGVLFRWIHVISACVAVGGVFFLVVVLPAGLALVAEPSREEALLRWRGRFKIVIHTVILLLLISGTYNTLVNWEIYLRAPALAHGLWGPHLFLALVVFGIALWVLAGPRPPAGHRRWMRLNLALLLIVVALASSLKAAREYAMRLPPPPAEIGR